MAKYVLLYSGSHPEGTEMEKVMKAWMAWYTELGSAVVDPGNPFAPVAKSITSDGTVSAVPVGAMPSGYLILQAESIDAAVGMAQRCPLPDGGEIKVYEINVFM